MRKERQTIAAKLLLQNTGQLGWLPKNPRQWTQTDIDRTVASITEDPDFLDDRPLLVVPYEGKYIVFAGNLRTEAIRRIKVKEVPCVVYYCDDGDGCYDDCLTIKRRAMKDNGSFGSWNYDILANEWDDMPLADWGVPSWDGDDAQQIRAGGGDRKGEEDDFDEEKDCIKVLCKPGDVWQLGDHRLMCGDSVDLQQVKILMGGVY